MERYDEIVRIFNQRMFAYEQFLASIRVFFERHPLLNSVHFPIVHSIKWRVKDIEHVKDKVKRKAVNGITVDAGNFHDEITDIIGVRVLHLHQDQFRIIHNAIMEKIDVGDWVLFENPKAYTWDPESIVFYQEQGLRTEHKETFYTSIHYVIKPNKNSPICCEIQVRTLFEEIWGEIDHTINYPHKTASIACNEQLRVLSKLVSTGTRLADSIFRSHNDHLFNK